VVVNTVITRRTKRILSGRWDDFTRPAATLLTSKTSYRWILRQKVTRLDRESLIALELHNCNYLTSLPEAISNHVSLQKLCIYNCLLLQERYARPYGKDWRRISSIREVEILPMRPSLFKYFTWVERPIKGLFG
jgi:hypothetical protein